jgi:hypothetical protein
MRIESSVTSLSWIPLGAVEGFFRLPFELGVALLPQPELLRGLWHVSVSPIPRTSFDLVLQPHPCRCR